MTLSSQTCDSVGIRRQAAFTLAEVVVSIFICMMAFAAIIKCYNFTAMRAQWSGYSLAAQAVSIQQLESARAAVWDYTAGKNELTNLNLLNWQYNSSTRVGTGYSVSIMDIPVTSTNNFITATNLVTIRTIYLNNVSNPPVQVQMVRVDTIWPFHGYGERRVYTNSIANYFAPDNRTEL